MAVSVITVLPSPGSKKSPAALSQTMSYTALSCAKSKP